jgi:hypothetical protein
MKPRSDVGPAVVPRRSMLLAGCISGAESGLDCYARAVAICMVRARPRQQFVFARRGLAMMRATRWILPFTCLRRWCVAKLSLDRQQQHFYYYLYSVKITNLGKISASRSSSAAVRAASAEGSRCRLELRIRLSYLTTEAATRMTWIKRTSDMPRAFGGSGFSENGVLNDWPVRSTDSLRPLSDIENAYEGIRGISTVVRLMDER